jgi:hypothetical protein
VVFSLAHAEMEQEWEYLRQSREPSTGDVVSSSTTSAAADGVIGTAEMDYYENHDVASLYCGTGRGVAPINILSNPSYQPHVNNIFKLCWAVDRCMSGIFGSVLLVEMLTWLHDYLVCEYFGHLADTQQYQEPEVAGTVLLRRITVTDDRLVLTILSAMVASVFRLWSGLLPQDANDTSFMKALTQDSLETMLQSLEDLLNIPCWLLLAGKQCLNVIVAMSDRESYYAQYCKAYVDSHDLGSLIPSSPPLIKTVTAASTVNSGLEGIKIFNVRWGRMLAYWVKLIEENGGRRSLSAPYASSRSVPSEKHGGVQSCRPFPIVSSFPSDLETGTDVDRRRSAASFLLRQGEFGGVLVGPPRRSVVITKQELVCALHTISQTAKLMKTGKDPAAGESSVRSWTCKQICGLNLVTIFTNVVCGWCESIRAYVRDTCSLTDSPTSGSQTETAVTAVGAPSSNKLGKSYILALESILTVMTDKTSVGYFLGLSSTSSTSSSHRQHGLYPLPCVSVMSKEFSNEPRNKKGPNLAGTDTAFDSLRSFTSPASTGLDQCSLRTSSCSASVPSSIRNENNLQLDTSSISLSSSANYHTPTQQHSIPPDAIVEQPSLILKGGNVADAKDIMGHGVHRVQPSRRYLYVLLTELSSLSLECLVSLTQWIAPGAGHVLRYNSLSELRDLTMASSVWIVSLFTTASKLLHSMKDADTGGRHSLKGKINIGNKNGLSSNVCDGDAVVPALSDIIIWSKEFIIQICDAHKLLEREMMLVTARASTEHALVASKWDDVLTFAEAFWKECEHGAWPPSVTPAPSCSSIMPTIPVTAAASDLNPTGLTDSNSPKKRSFQGIAAKHGVNCVGHGTDVHSSMKTKPKRTRVSEELGSSVETEYVVIAGAAAPSSNNRARQGIVPLTYSKADRVNIDGQSQPSQLSPMSKDEIVAVGEVMNCDPVRLQFSQSSIPVTYHKRGIDVDGDVVDNRNAWKEEMDDDNSSTHSIAQALATIEEMECEEDTESPGVEHKKLNKCKLAVELSTHLAGVVESVQLLAESFAAEASDLTTGGIQETAHRAALEQVTALQLWLVDMRPAKVLLN